MKTLSEQEKEDMDKILQKVGETLIATMIYVEIPNFIELKMADEEGALKYKLRFEKLNEK